MEAAVFPVDISIRDQAESFLAKTSLYQACARIPLPSRVKKFIWNRLDDVLSYSSEIFVVLILAYALFSGYSQAGVRSQSIKADFWKIVTHPDFPETAEELCPRFFSWYTFFLPIQQRTNLEIQRIAHEARNTKKNFQALFVRSPAEAVMIYQAQLLNRGGGRLPKTPSGHVRLHFYTNFEKGNSPDQLGFPDAILDLPVQQQGVDLALARKTWGIESIGVITNAESFKKVFYPANEDWLSPLAVYDLSRQFRQPIKVFEPRVHKFTKAERKIRWNLYHFTFLTFSITKLLLGFPERNTSYLSVAYGPRYATFYERVGKFTLPIKDWFATGGFLFLQLAIIIGVLPFVVAYNICSAVVKTVQWVAILSFGAISATTRIIYQSAAATAKTFINLVFTMLQIACLTVVSTATFIISLPIQGWFAVFAVAWWVTAEYYHHIS